MKFYKRKNYSDRKQKSCQGPGVEGKTTDGHEETFKNKEFFISCLW